MWKHNLLHLNRFSRTDTDNTQYAVRVSRKEQTDRRRLTAGTEKETGLLEI